MSIRVVIECETLSQGSVLRRTERLAARVQSVIRSSGYSDESSLEDQLSKEINMMITQSFFAFVRGRKADTNKLRSYDAEISPPSTQSRAQSASYGSRANANLPRVVPPTAAGEFGRHRSASQRDRYAFERTQSNLG